MVKTLLTSRRFAPLFWTQFLAALNDNFLKQSLVLLCLFQIGGPTGAMLGTLAGAVLIAPFFLLSAFAGELADKHDKAMLARRMKFAEIFAAAFAAAGFALQSVTLLMIALGLYGIVAALFGPIKYGLLPDQLATEELAAGNALIESGTFLAVLIGPVAAGWAAARHQSPYVMPTAIMTVAVACWLASRFIPRVEPKAADLTITKNPWTSTLHLVRETKQDKRIWDGTLIVSWFWLAGAVTLSLLAPIVTQSIGGTENVNTLFMLVFALGVAIGSLLAARWSRHRPNMAVVPVGGVVMALGSLALAVTLIGMTRAEDVGALAFAATPRGVAMLAEFLMIAVGGGFFVVPSFAAVQAWAAPEKRARVIAVNNVISAAFIVGASVVVAALQYLAPAMLSFSRRSGSAISSSPRWSSRRGAARACAISPAACSRRSSASRRVDLKTCRAPASASSSRQIMSACSTARYCTQCCRWRPPLRLTRASRRLGGRSRSWR